MYAQTFNLPQTSHASPAVRAKFQRISAFQTLHTSPPVSVKCQRISALTQCAAGQCSFIMCCVHQGLSWTSSRTALHRDQASNRDSWGPMHIHEHMVFITTQQYTRLCKISPVYSSAITSMEDSRGASISHLHPLKDSKLVDSKLSTLYPSAAYDLPHKSPPCQSL